MKNKVNILTLSAIASLIFMALVLPNAVLAGDTLSYRLKWLRNVSVAGSLFAETHELFKKEGLDVEVKPGGPERDAIRELELGHADFGTASADQVLRARAKGSPVVVIAQLFQVNPLQWMYRPEELKIESLEDLKGKTIGVTFGGNDEAIMRTLLARGGLGETDVKLFSVRYDYTPFYRRQVQMWPVYRNAQGPIISAQLAKENEKVAFFNPADFGVKFVANSIVTHADTLKEKPEVVGKFVKALLLGWEQALDPANTEETLRILQKYDPDTSPEIQAQQLEITRMLIKPEANVAIGEIDEKGWKQTQDIMQTQNLLPAGGDVKAALQPVEPVNR